MGALNLVFLPATYTVHSTGTAEMEYIFIQKINKKLLLLCCLIFTLVFATSCSSGKLAKQYNIKVQPLTLVLSPDHKLLAALLGGVSEAELQELLGKYLQD